ncbi:MAG: phage/plasmid primase, P4 family [Alphaproteobacteria bacterium]
MLGDAGAPDTDRVIDPRPPEFSDDALASRFTAYHAGQLRYTEVWRRWSRWDGSRWRDDKTLAVFDLARAICRAAAAEAKLIGGTRSAALAAALASAKTVAAVERLARADRRHATHAEAWDADPWLLNTPGGTVDLRTGAIHSNNPDDLITKITSVAPSDLVPTTWLRVLRRVTAGNEEMVAFLQRIMGYALTGSIREHAMFFFYGTGGNGKSLVLNTVSSILGDYATTAPMETFAQSTGDRHPTELAHLRSARLVTAQETEEGRRWAEARIKSLTGGDTIAARYMGRDFFTFAPQFKLLIAGNQKPGLRNVDEAIRRRFNLIPFSETITPEERDPDLAEKLRVEWPGILSWMIQGSIEWQREGLRAPTIVTSATERYLSDQDFLGAWLAESCELRSGAQERSSVLFSSWKSWAERNGVSPGTNMRLTEQLESRGFGRVRTNSGAVFRGLSVLTITVNDAQSKARSGESDGL